MLPRKPKIVVKCPECKIHDMQYVNHMVVYYCPNCTFKKVVNWMIKTFSAPGLLTKMMGGTSPGFGPVPNFAGNPPPVDLTQLTPMSPDAAKTFVDSVKQGLMQGMVQGPQDAINPVCVFCGKEEKDCLCPKNEQG